MRRPDGHPPVLKRLGQHFLVDRGALEAIAAAVDPQPGETVVEIGPGRGALTDILATTADNLIAIELDRALAAALSARHQENPAITILQADFLTVDLAALVTGPFSVVGNVPYYITTPIIFHVLRPPLPRAAVFLVQREVADRIVSPPGSREYGALSVNVQAVAHAEIVREVPPGAFRPPPRVKSAVVRLTPREVPLVSPAEIEPLRQLVLALFGMRRKQMANALRSAGGLSPEAARAVLAGEGIDPQARPETLAPDQFVRLMRALRRLATEARGHEGFQ